MTWIHVQDHGSVCADLEPGLDRASGLMYCQEGLAVVQIPDRWPPPVPQAGAAVSGFAPPPGYHPDRVPAAPARRVLFIGGPLDCQVQHVPPADHVPWADSDDQAWLYTVDRFPFGNRVIWVGHLTMPSTLEVMAALVKAAGLEPQT